LALLFALAALFRPASRAVRSADASDCRGISLSRCTGV
jgi:hypothetical protein